MLHSRYDSHHRTLTKRVIQTVRTTSWRYFSTASCNKTVVVRIVHIQEDMRLSSRVAVSGVNIPDCLPLFRTKVRSFRRASTTTTKKAASISCHSNKYNTVNVRALAASALHFHSRRTTINQVKQPKRLLSFHTPSTTLDKGGDAREGTSTAETKPLRSLHETLFHSPPDSRCLPNPIAPARLKYEFPTMDGVHPWPSPCFPNNRPLVLLPLRLCFRSTPLPWPSRSHPSLSLSGLSRTMPVLHRRFRMMFSGGRKRVLSRMSVRISSRVQEFVAGSLLEDGVAHRLLLMVPSSFRNRAEHCGGSERHLRR